MNESLSRQLGRFASRLTYSDLPPEVIDKAKALLLHSLAAGLVGSTTPRGQAAIRLAKEEEGREGGATILVDGSRATRMGAAFANSQLMRIPEQWDSYRMLTHPGLTVVPAALATAELESSSGQELLTAMVAGYETLVRLAGDFIPSTQARGFRSSGVYGVFGAAVTTGKLLGLNEDQAVVAIALAATFAAGTAEGARMRTDEMTYQEPSAARNGILAALLARDGATGAETAVEGKGGFYYAFTGSNKGELSYVFTGASKTDLDRIVQALGQHYELLNVCFKMYPTSGYNIPIINLMASLKQAHDIQPEQVERMKLEMNWLETLYPSPAFPIPAPAVPTIGSKEYFAAYTCVEGDYPFFGTPQATFSAIEQRAPERAAQILELMRKIEIVGVEERTFFAPKMSVTMKDGSFHQGELTGEELKWGLEEEIQKIKGLVPWLPITAGQFDELIATVREVERLERVDRLLQLTRPR